MENRRYKQRKLTPEQRLFKRTVTLAFLTGLAFGLMIWFLGTDTYNFIRSGFMNPLLWPPSFVWPLNAVRVIVEGAFIALLSGTINLSSQFLNVPQWENSRSAFLRSSKHISMIMGFFIMGGGVEMLLDKPLTLALADLKASSLEILIGEIALTALCVLVIPISLSWYLLRKDSAMSRSLEAQQHTR